MKGAAQTLSTVTVVIALVSLTQTAMLSQIMSGIKYTNFYLHTILINVPRGPESNALFTVIYEACRFVFWSPEEYYDEYIGFDDDEAVSPRFEELGYDTQHFIKALDMQFLLWVWAGAYFLVMKILTCFKWTKAYAEDKL